MADNLSYVRNLIVNPSAWDDDLSRGLTRGWMVFIMTEFMTTHVEGDLVSGKCYLCMLEWSHLGERALDKVGQLRNLEVNQLVQVNNQDPVQWGFRSGQRGPPDTR